MPIYKYSCETCSHITEIYCTFDEKTKIEKTLMCEGCGSAVTPKFSFSICGKSSGSSCGGTCNSCSGCH